MLPTEAREGYTGLVGDACARLLDMVESTADDHLAPSTVLTQMFVVGADPEHAGCCLYPLRRRRPSDC